MNTQPSQHSPISSAIASAFPSDTLSRPILLTVEQLSNRNPAFTPASLRNLIFKANERKSSVGVVNGNGLVECGAIIRLGRRVLIDESKFLSWVASGGARE